jgi:hypothetical protein
MTKIAITPNASGTGTFTITAPESNTGRTFTLPDATGEILTDAQNDPAKLFRQDNILGTVSESGGVPTGAIIERGSNANGEFVRYADGTLIMWKDISADLALIANTYTTPATLTATASSSLSFSVDARVSSWDDNADRFTAQQNAIARIQSTTTVDVLVNPSAASYLGSFGGFSYIVTGRWF